MGVGTLTIDTAAILEEVKKQGFIILKEFMVGPELDRLQADADWFLEQPRDWYQLTRNERTRFANVSPFRVPLEDRERLQGISDTFT